MPQVLIQSTGEILLAGIDLNITVKPKYKNTGGTE
jgi:hypothetical protein